MAQAGLRIAPAGHAPAGCAPIGHAPAGPARTESEPRFLQLARQLQEGLAQGRWAWGAALPSERRLAELCQVSRMTLRKALALLREQGWLAPLHDAQSNLEARWLSPAPIGRDGRIRWLSREIAEADTEELAGLVLARPARVLRERWLHELGGRPQAVVSHCARATAALPAASASRPAPRGPGRLRQQIRAVVADAPQAQLLDVPSGAPLLHLRQWRFAADGAATELRQAYWRADASPLLMELRW